MNDNKDVTLIPETTFDPEYVWILKHINNGSVQNSPNIEINKDPKWVPTNPENFNSTQTLLYFHKKMGAFGES